MVDRLDISQQRLHGLPSATVVAGTQEPASSDGDPRSVSTRGRLLEAAYELLVERGYHATTVQNVARRAGLTTGAIYAHFATKQELMAAAVLDRLFRVGPEVLPEPPHPDADDLDWLNGFLANHLAVEPTPEHRLLTEVTGAVIREDRPKSPLFEGVLLVDAVVRNSIGRAQDRGAISGHLSADALATIVVNLYLGAITSKAWGLPQPDRDETLEILSLLTRRLSPDHDDDADAP